MSSSWTVGRDTAKGPRSYTRLLGNEELGFYWDAAFSGTATTIQDFEVNVSHQSLLDEGNVVRAWLRLKNMFPLLACKVIEGDGDAVRFYVDEERLRTTQCGEVEVHNIHSDEDVMLFSERILNGPPLDCTKLLSRVLVLRKHDRPTQCRVLIPVAHCITDGMGNGTLVRTFCNELCSPSVAPDEGLTSFEDRLSSILPLEALHPKLKMSPARIKWRKAVAKVIFQLRQQKLTGGHSLPNRLNPKSMYKPALSKELYFVFSKDATESILTKCRAQNITFGNALHVISQLAHARVLHRLRLQHEQDANLEFGISQEDWENRIRQPMHFGGPLNLRPLLSPSWYQNGGSTEICLCIGFWYISLPSMPFCKRPVESWAMQFPSFEELMPRTRFKRRVDFVARKMALAVKNPLFLEISLNRMPMRVERSRRFAKLWRERMQNPDMESPSDPTPPVVFANGGSSLGNRDLLLPNEYPINSQKDKEDVAPQLKIGRHVGHLRCRPAELYIGALMRHKKLEYFVLYDGNVFDEKIVQMWMDEAKAATLHYLTTDTVQRETGFSKSRL